ncbi:tropomyosin-like [Linepithema humile]|uniref:tropomyosin-like n=1 Tax=Linepithema humile TaxID=83485 RepID=UPI00351E548B
MSSCGARSKCIVPGCGNVYCKAIVKNPHIRFHKVPKNIQLKEQWAHVCGKSLEKFTGFICSNHLKKNDYERGLAEALGESSKPRLKCTAIPSLHLPISDDLNANKENTELSDIIFTQSSLDKENIESGHTIFKQSSPTHDENPLLNTCYKNAITQTEEHFCDIINMRLNCVTKKFEESEESRKNLEIELNKFKVKYEAAITELNATNSEIIELKNNNNQLRCYKDAITQTEEHFCDIINMRLNCVTKKFEESEESRKNLEIELNKFKVKYEAAITELNATNSEIIELKNNNNQLRCYKDAITQTEEHFCDIINIRLNCVTKKFEESEESRKNLEIELNEFKAKYEAAITELNATNSEIIELKNNNNRLNSCLNKLLTQCQIDIALNKKNT